MYVQANARGQRGNSSRANPRTGQRRLTQDRFALFVFRLSAFEHDKSASARGFVWLPFDNAGRINRKLLSLCRTTVNSAVHVAPYIYAAHIYVDRNFMELVLFVGIKKKHTYSPREAYVSQILITKLLRADCPAGVRAVSNYRDINAGREFDRHFRETSRAVILPRVILPRVSARQPLTRAYIYVVYYVSCIHAWFRVCWRRVWPCSVRACIPDLSADDVSLQIAKLLTRACSKGWEGKAVPPAGWKDGERGTCTIQYPTNLVSRTRVKFLLQYKRTK